jgi:hypothetical protein|tara:strand:- start:134 stop:385 length:252 start_codon:yes stop_codon:yes gene_type:complete
MANESKMRPQGRKKQSGSPGLGLLGGSKKKEPEEKEGKIRVIMVGKDGEMLDQPMFEKFSKGGSVKKKKSSGKAIRGKGCEIR